jgi:pimeloyl-ACP methyl ester carboxylesterase
MSEAIFESADTTRIWARCSGNGPPLVMVHGATADHTRWLGVLDALAARFTCFLIDRRGRGRSGDEPGYAMEREYEDIVAVVEAQRTPTIVLGHSFGAICALEAALRVDLAALILYEPPFHNVIPHDFLAEADRLAEAGDNEALLRFFFTVIAEVPVARLDTLAALPSWAARVEAAPTVIREVRAFTEYRFDPARFAALHVPTALLVGGASRAAEHRTASELLLAIPHARLVDMPGQDHFAMDSAPTVFVHEVNAFVDSLPALGAL